MKKKILKLYGLVFLLCTAQSSFPYDGIVFKYVPDTFNALWAVSFVMVPFNFYRLEQRGITLSKNIFLLAFCYMTWLLSAKGLLNSSDFDMYLPLIGAFANTGFLLISSLMVHCIDSRRERMGEEAIAV